jgi:hypothetical protein
LKKIVELETMGYLFVGEQIVNMFHYWNLQNLVRRRKREREIRICTSERVRIIIIFAISSLNSPLLRYLIIGFITNVFFLCA